MKPSKVTAVYMLFAMALVLAAGITAHADNPAEEARATIDTEQERMSYVIGVQMGSSIQQGGIDVASEALMQGMTDVLENNDLALSEAELQEAMMALQRKMNAAHEEQQRQLQEQQQRMQEQQQQMQEPPQQIPQQDIQLQ